MRVLICGVSIQGNIVYVNTYCLDVTTYAWYTFDAHLVDPLAVGIIFESDVLAFVGTISYLILRVIDLYNFLKVTIYQYDSDCAVANIGTAFLSISLLEQTINMTDVSFEYHSAGVFLCRE